MITQLHIVRGIDPPIIRNGFINLIIKGNMNRVVTEIRAGSNKGRLTVTLNVMVVLKKLFRQWEKPMSEKLLVWTVCTLPYAG